MGAVFWGKRHCRRGLGGQFNFEHTSPDLCIFPNLRRASDKMTARDGVGLLKAEQIFRRGRNALTTFSGTGCFWRDDWD